MSVDLATSLDFTVCHVGIAVPSLESAADTLSSLFGFHTVSGPFEDPLQKVRVLFLAKSSSDVAEIELVAPLGDNSPVHSMLAKGKGGAYHLCMQTTDLDSALQHVRENGCVVVSEPQPAVAFAGRRIAWIYTPTRQLFELVEAQSPSQT